MDKIRVHRIIEYVGDRKAVEDQLKRCLHGEKTVTLHKLGTVTIKAATLGVVPEMVEEDEEDGD